VKLTTALTKELDSTMEEVEFWQEKFEEAMKTIQKLKRHYSQGVETLSNEETEEFTLATSQDGDSCTSNLRCSQ
jgi:prefoldin subunit 5